MFYDVLDLSQKFMGSLYDFSKSILDFMNYEIVIADNTYSVFTVLFTGAIILIISYGVIKFVVGI